MYLFSRARTRFTVDRTSQPEFSCGDSGESHPCVRHFTLNAAVPETLTSDTANLGTKKTSQMYHFRSGRGKPTCTH